MTERHSLVYAVNCYLAAMLALAISFLFNLSNPYWAAVTVYIVSQPLGAAVGAVWAKASYRLLGTMVALGVALVIIPNLADTPVLMVGAISAWIALCTYMSLLDRTPRNYAFLLAGFTAAIIGFPTVDDPSALFAVALARAEEITIGVVCAAVVQTLSFPRHAVDIVRLKVGTTLEEGRRLIGAALQAGQPAQGNPATKSALPVELSEIHGLSDSLRFESVAAGRVPALLKVLEANLVELPALAATLAAQLQDIHAQGGTSQELTLALDKVRAWVTAGEGDHPVAMEAVIASCRAAAPEPRPVASWKDILVADLVVQLEELVLVWDRCLRLTAQIRSRGAGDSDDPAKEDIAYRDRVLHVDHALAAYSGIAAGIAVAITAGYAMLIGWSQGAAAVGIAAAASMVFAAADDPAPFQRILVLLVLVAIPIAAVYQLAVFPLINGFPLLALALFPILMLAGMLLANPKFALPGLGFALTTQTLISLQPSARGDLVTVLNIGIATAMGALLALAVTRLIRVISPATAAHRIQRAGWHDMNGLAVGANPLAGPAWASLMLDRESLLRPRLGKLADQGSPLPIDALNDLVIGNHIIGLRDAQLEEATPQGAETKNLLRALGEHFEALAKGRASSRASNLLDRIDRTLDALIRAPRSRHVERSAVAIAGLRRSLFPSAQRYSVKEKAA